MQNNQIFNEILAKNTRNGAYFISTDVAVEDGNKDTNAYALLKKHGDGAIEILLTKTECDKDKFLKTVEILTAIFNATPIKLR